METARPGRPAPPLRLGRKSRAAVHGENAAGPAAANAELPGAEALLDLHALRIVEHDHLGAKVNKGRVLDFV